MSALLFTTSIYGEPLPSPLTLNKALSYVDGSHPDLALADARLYDAISEKLFTDSMNNIEAFIELAPTTVLPSTNNDFINDSYARLSVSKTLYDFGYSHSLKQSANAMISTQQLLAADARNQHYLKIQRLFFDVILADLYYLAINEKSASHYVKFDKLRNRRDLGMISDVPVLEAQSVYRETANLRVAGEKNQFASRQRLAIALNKPNSIPGALRDPHLPQLKQDAPKFEGLFSTVLKNNLNITALQQTVLADKSALAAVKQQYGPKLTAELEWNAYSREINRRNQASLAFFLRVPFANKQRLQASAAHASAKLATSQALYDQAVHVMRQRLLDLINRLETLRHEQDTDTQRLESRGLTLDKNRARYELELQTSLGSSMASYTEAEWLAKKSDFEIAMIWTQIDILSGKKLYLNKEQ